MVIKRKEHFYSLTETEHNILPVFTVQVWDNDIFTPDDFIGKCVLNNFSGLKKRSLKVYCTCRLIIIIMMVIPPPVVQ